LSGFRSDRVLFLESLAVYVLRQANVLYKLLEAI
jgi:hypothetical protein